ncbi:hypothetical protein [Hymenobacter daeguensis]
MPILLLRAAASWPLPGLGLLALPDGPTPHLLPYALHTALAVVSIGPGGERHSGTATVEEVARPDEAGAPVRALLLDLNGPVMLLPGTEIWLHNSMQ